MKNSCTGKALNYDMKSSLVHDKIRLNPSMGSLKEGEKLLNKLYMTKDHTGGH